MSKKLFLFALAPLAATLFLPWQSVGLGGASITDGILGGTLTNPGYLLFLLPGLVAALVGALGRGEVGRVRGVITGVLALIGLGLHSLFFTPEHDAGLVSLAAGFYLSALGALVAVVAGFSTLFTKRNQRAAAGAPASAAV